MDGLDLTKCEIWRVGEVLTKMDQITLYLFYSITANMLLILILLYFRSEIMIGFKLRWLTRFIDYCKVRIYTRDKRVKTYIIQADKELKEFKIENMGIYTIDPELAYFEGSIPTYLYNEDNFKPLDPSDLQASMLSDPLLVDKVVLRAKASGKLADFFKNIKTIILLLLIIGAICIAGTYLSFKIYKFFEPVLKTTLDKLLADMFIKYCSGANTIIV